MNTGRRLISEPVSPIAGFNTGAMTRGEPGIPLAFTWRGTEYRIRTELRSWRELRPCRNGSGEQYAGKHYHEILTECGKLMVLYRERSGSKKDKWILYTITEATALTGDTPVEYNDKEN